MPFRHCTAFQHDGAPCHQAGPVKRWFADAQMEVWGPWLGSSSDINPIENCWAVLKGKVASLEPSSNQDLMDKTQRVWTTKITLEYCCKLIESMPARLKTVLKAKGGPTKY